MRSHHQISLFSVILLLCLLSSALSAERCHSDEKKTLLKIKEAFNNVYYFISWTNNTDCCDWTFVACDELTNHITYLSITRYHVIAGPIPEAVGDLPYLEELIFTDLSRVTGPIPRTISNLKNLKSLTISHINLTGSIPNFFGSLTKLTHVEISNTKLTGPIPSSLSSLPNLKSVFLHRNQLTGPIPEGFGELINNPDCYLTFAYNKLSGPLPKSLGAANISLIDLSRNMFTGDASMLFGKNKSVSSIDISRNKFSFDLTNVEVPMSLIDIDIRNNLIYGSLPPTFAMLPNFQQFNVSYNRLCGKIPTGGDLNRFDKYSYAHNKCLCGTPLPPCK